MNDLADLDLNNIGVHFTLNLSYKHSGGGSNGLTNNQANYRIDIYVREYTTNEEATAVSNANYSTEQEVVVDMNCDVICEVKVFPRVDGGWGRIIQDYSTSANTGTRADLWVKNL